MAKHLENLTVLVADDSAINLMVMTQVLTDAGANVITAVNGREVLEKLENQLADIVLMDLQMPELDGFEAARTIRRCGQSYSNIPIVAITAESAQSEIEKSIDYGMNGFITKPFAPRVILEKIQSLLQVPSSILKINDDEKKTKILPDFDLTYLKEITSGQKDKLILIVDNLVINGPLLLNESMEAVKMNNWAEAAGYLHKVKGLLGLFFMPKIIEAVAHAEENTKSKSPNNEVIIEEIGLVSVQLKINIDLIVNQI